MSHIQYDPRANGPRAPIASSSYDHDDRHFHFQRSHSGDLETTSAVYGWGSEVLRFTGVVACIAILWAMAWVASGIFY
jgi:hypothetical protein